MADSPNSSAPQTNIDDLVKELSRPQGSAPSPASPSPVNPAPKPMSQSAPMSSAPSLPPRPATPPPITSTPTPVPPVSPVILSVPKEYQSSIRTMSDDLAKLKAGQQPQGVNIPRKIDNTPVPAKPAVPAAPVPAPSKPMSTTSLPSAVKSAPLPSSPNQQAPKVPTSAPIPRPIMPSMPSAAKTPETKLDQKNQFYVPPAEAKPAGSRNLLFAGIAVAVVLLGVLYWYFMIQGSSPVAVESPVATFTPRPTATPNPDVLSTIFTTHGGAIVLPSSGDPTVAFSNAISAQPNITQGTLTVIDVASGGASASAQILTISGFLNRFIVAYPPALQTALGQNYKFLLYGQKESFDTKGRPVTNVAPGSRLVMVSEVASSSASILQGWEPTMSANLSGVMAIAPAKNTSSFLATNYRGVSVRFKNFPYPDHSIDYALVQYNSKTYLVIAGSREAMFATIDTFLVPGNL